MKYRYLLPISLATAISSVASAQTLSVLELPEGNKILQLTGADNISTPAGPAISETRTIYFFNGDFDNPQPNLHNFTSNNMWPYVYVTGTVTVDASITASVTTVDDGNASTGDVLLINGNPVYQFVNDTSASDANGNFGPWFYSDLGGNATQSTAAVPVDLAPAISDVTENDDGSFSNWLGKFTPEGANISNEGWIQHTEHGRLYLAASGEDLWLYDPNVAALGEAFHGWIYSNRTIFPYFFIDSSTPDLFLLFVSGAEGPSPTTRVFVDTVNTATLFLPKVSPRTIVDIAAGNPAFSSLVTALSTADLVEPLSGEGPFTVFAPTDDAFAKLDPDTLNDLLTNEDSLPALSNILTYHVIPGRLTSGDLGLDLGSILRGESLSGFATTLGGSDLRLDVTPFGILLNGSTLVTTPDIEGSNGVIHVIDSVLMPPSDIVDTAVAGGFSTLVTAVQAAVLEDALRGDGPLTVFAPTDEAFAALGDETLNSLLADPETLADILLYHVVSGDIYASEAAPGEVPMLNGDPATFDLTESGSLTIEGANIIGTDIVTSNGVIHVIDAVILPPSE